jgi:hypothetical protein
MRDSATHGSEILFAGAGLAVVTLTLQAFEHWGGDAHGGSSPGHAAGVASLPEPFRGQGDPPTRG